LRVSDASVRSPQEAGRDARFRRRRRRWIGRTAPSVAPGINLSDASVLASRKDAYLKSAAGTLESM
jgi:hypothetical protein